MNSVAITYAEVILGVVVCSLVITLVFPRELLQRLSETVAWLLKASFFDFVLMVIFIKPWKTYVRPIGVVLWLVLVYITGRYMIVIQPKLSDIAGPYIPMIGYVYLLSLLFIVSFVLYIAGRRSRDN